ncbi:unnamed protein product [Pleuronectes platessa]|uniref:Uncharacterized protein n=1 Tax=Pleuronectes platessa TaxID=8262 RepID=A0A9N7TZK1_PLEPL|nr:unnamed protein product [Pleuronectes platessa]
MEDNIGIRPRMSRASLQLCFTKRTSEKAEKQRNRKPQRDSRSYSVTLSYWTNCTFWRNTGWLVVQDGCQPSFSEAYNPPPPHPPSVFSRITKDLSGSSTSTSV